MVTRASRLVRYSSRCDDSSPVNSWCSTRMVFLLLGLLSFMLILGGCEFFGSNLFPMYLGFTDATINVRDLVRETYPNARGFDIRQAKFARYIVDNVDYSKVIVFVEVFSEVEPRRLLLFLDPFSLRPVRVVDEDEILLYESSPIPIYFFDSISVTPFGFWIGDGIFDPLNISVVPAFLLNEFPNRIVLQKFQNTDFPDANDIILTISRNRPFDLSLIDIDGTILGSNTIEFDSNPTDATLLDAYFSSDGLRLNLLIQAEGIGVGLYSIQDFNNLTNGTPNIVTESDIRIPVSLNTLNIFTNERQSYWLVKDMIVDTSKNNSNRGYQLTAIRTNDELAGYITISDRDWSRYEVLDIDKGDQDISRWWLLYDRNTGLLYKNRVWWSQ